MGRKVTFEGVSRILLEGKLKQTKTYGKYFEQYTVKIVSRLKFSLLCELDCQMFLKPGHMLDSLVEDPGWQRHLFSDDPQ